MYKTIQKHQNTPKIRIGIVNNNSLGRPDQHVCSAADLGWAVPSGAYITQTHYICQSHYILYVFTKQASLEGKNHLKLSPYAYFSYLLLCVAQDCFVWEPLTDGPAMSSLAVTVDVDGYCK